MSVYSKVHPVYLARCIRRAISELRLGESRNWRAYMNALEVVKEDVLAGTSSAIVILDAYYNVGDQTPDDDTHLIEYLQGYLK